MRINCLILWLFCLYNVPEGSCFIEPITGIIGGGIAAGLYYGYTSLKCSYQECCNDEYIQLNIKGLSSLLSRNLFGQQVAINPVVSALEAHLQIPNSRKALVMAFHGLPGTGKNYMTEMIRDFIYKKGIESKYYHFFNGRSEFPLESEVPYYKAKLRDTIAKALQNCPRSLFVFDEVDDMAEGVLDTLVPFLDYGPTQIWIDSSNQVIETRKAIFIFLSNAGSQQIINRTIELWNQGKSRDETHLADFENLIVRGAFNEKGGFHKSDAISTSLIDHYVPFLPLEIEHVKSCIKTAFHNYRIDSPTTKQIEEVMSYITYGPEPYKLYAKNGCKTIEKKVAVVAYQRTRNN